jgi:hypothetical protein
MVQSELTISLSGSSRKSRGQGNLAFAVKARGPAPQAGNVVVFAIRLFKDNVGLMVLGTLIAIVGGGMVLILLFLGVAFLLLIVDAGRNLRAIRRDQSRKKRPSQKSRKSLTWHRRSIRLLPGQRSR